MYTKARSGQFVFFTLAGVASGLPITGAASAVSGRVSLDAAAQSVVAGPITEIGGGQYAFGTYAADINGNNVGYLFTASGAALVSFSVVTLATTSGGLFLASGSVTSGVICSGVFVTVPIASISGVQPISGATVSVPISSVSGLTANSGLFVTVLPANLSGVVANSGLFVNATATVASGLFVSVPISSISGVVPASGGFVNASLNSGQQTVPYSGQLSGQQVALVSGTSVNVFSGSLRLASGEVTYRIPYNVLSFDFTNFSGLIASGLSGRCVVNAERKLTNKWSLTDVSGYLRVYQEDDSNFAYDQAFTSVSGGQPISSLDTK